MKSLCVCVVWCALAWVPACGDGQGSAPPGLDAPILVTPGSTPPGLDAPILVTLSLDEAVARAEERDVGLKRLRFSQGELARTKKNLYRSYFPAVDASMSGSNLVSQGGPDMESYRFTLNLEQVLYDQFATPFMIQNHSLSLEEASLNAGKRRRAIEHETAGLYLETLLSEEKLANKREELELAQRYVGLTREAFGVGMKTFLEVTEAENDLLDTELELEEIEARKKVLYEDLAQMVGLAEGGRSIELADSLNDVAAQLFFGETAAWSSFEMVFERLLDLHEDRFDRERLFLLALDRDLELKRLELSLRQNMVRRKLTSMEFLESVSLGYQLDFLGERMFPVNTAHTFYVNVGLDFDLISSDLSVRRTPSRDRRISSGAADSELLGTLTFMDEARTLRFESSATAETIEERKRGIYKGIEVWEIKFKGLTKSFTIMKRQLDMFRKNDELFRLQLEMGDVSEVDYFEFLLEKSEFLIEFETLKYAFIRLLWDLEEIVNMRIREVIA